LNMQSVQDLPFRTPCWYPVFHLVILWKIPHEVNFHS
jgi:hypothetical protein